MKPKRQIRNMQIQEVSLVESPANMRKFLFFKQEEGDDILKIEISTDGTKKGTTILVNGEQIEKLDSFYFSLWSNGSDGYVNCDFSKVIATDDGFQRTENYKLAKGASAMNEKINKVLKAFFGEDRQVQKVDKDEDRLTAVEKAVEAIKNYRDDMPEELAKAIGSLVECGLQGLMKNETDDIKTKKNTETDNKQNDNVFAVTKALEEIKVQMETANKANEKVSKSVETLGERITKLEELDGSSQVLKGQDTNLDNEEDPFPSLAM